jgi:hypothetical protein
MEKHIKINYKRKKKRKIEIMYVDVERNIFLIQHYILILKLSMMVKIPKVLKHQQMLLLEEEDLKE